MKTNKLTLIAILLAFTSSFTSCKDDDTEPVIETPPVQFDISSPTTGSMYHLNDTVFIKAKISHTEELHGYEVSIVNISQNDTLVFNKHAHLDGTDFQIDEYWINNVSGHSNMKLIIDAITDHSGAKESSELSFHCHPM